MNCRVKLIYLTRKDKRIFPEYLSGRNPVARSRNSAYVVRLIFAETHTTGKTRLHLLYGILYMRM